MHQKVITYTTQALVFNDFTDHVFRVDVSSINTRIIAGTYMTKKDAYIVNKYTTAALNNARRSSRFGHSIFSRH